MTTARASATISSRGARTNSARSSSSSQVMAPPGRGPPMQLEIIVEIPRHLGDVGIWLPHVSTFTQEEALHAQQGDYDRGGGGWQRRIVNSDEVGAVEEANERRAEREWVKSCAYRTGRSTGRENCSRCPRT